MEEKYQSKDEIKTEQNTLDSDRAAALDALRAVEGKIAEHDRKVREFYAK